ncbi:hypothetical protein XA68_15178 [Ophiocordyceps unilateralis]|uniref:Amino acid permease/ SLC12A domain-containing protein n=1 Tax=Ophiocordyceps unilateralis TaxID=268505 RepID=A0A2A9PMF5_OPHUN|nr:hypothetical protein XA68_15178 [Ophiocordyceps unilateralis]
MLDDEAEIHTWLPDWLQTAIVLGSAPAAQSAPAGQGLLDGRPAPLPVTDRPSPSPGGGDSFVRREKVVLVTPSQDRMVNRKLRGINLSMIAVNATLGSGLYWTGGQVLKIGGPLAAPLSFLLPGLLAWAVMQCVTEMLCIWPIPGALSVYVSEFVDVELGIAVGVAYWFTYSVSFAALIATSAAEIHLWFRKSKVFDGVVIYLLIPVTLVLINSFEVEIYGWLEVAGSSIKITCLVVVMVLVGVLMNVWRAPVTFDRGVTNNWVTAFAICLSMATFAYVGVEVVAASALEARWPKKKTKSSARPGEELLISKTVKFSAVYIPILATVAYTLAALLASLSIDRSNCDLPRLSWIRSSCVSEQQSGAASIFVVIAKNSSRPMLKDVFNVILVFSVLTCANTNLYVASRTLFGLTTRLDGSPAQHVLLRFLAWFGKTNRRKVPLRALIFSAVAFLWVPFLQLDEGKDIAEFIEILAKMGTTGVVIVWACECWAFIRFYRCIWRHRYALKLHNVGQVRRWDFDSIDEYPYRSHGQPFVAYAALAGCLFILVISNGAPLWNGFHLTPFLAFFFLPLVFLALWVLLKVTRGARWSLVDLNNATKVVNKLRDLHDIRQGAS